ncbi:uncharacterized protein LOC141637311 [Silene latifolia]|uniref:uncharacterized protein LOC141637311 n=1 Tax=Silene latifolia TaxID=37657 RepID=UPI003D779F8E
MTTRDFASIDSGYSDLPLSLVPLSLRRSAVIVNISASAPAACTMLLISGGLIIPALTEAGGTLVTRSAIGLQRNSGEQFCCKHLDELWGVAKTLPDLTKLEKLDGHNYKRWSQKLLMFFEQLEIDYVLFSDPPAPVKEAAITETVENTPPAKSAVKSNEEDIRKFDKDNKLVRCQLLNNMTDTLFDLFMMADGKPIMEQVHVYENLCADVVNEGMKLDDTFVANVLLEKFPPSWSDYKNHLKHKKKDPSLQELLIWLSPVVRPIEKFKGKGKAKVGQGKSQGPAKKNGPGKHTKPVAKIQKPKGPIVCYVCGKTGHKAYQCTEKKTAEANVAMTDDVIAAVVVEANLVGNVL